MQRFSCALALAASAAIAFAGCSNDGGNGSNQQVVGGDRDDTGPSDDDSPDARTPIPDASPSEDSTNRDSSEEDSPPADDIQVEDVESAEDVSPDEDADTRTRGACCKNEACEFASESACTRVGGDFYEGEGCTSPNVPCSGQAGNVPCCGVTDQCMMLKESECRKRGGTPRFTSSCAQVNCQSRRNDAGVFRLCCLNGQCKRLSPSKCRARSGVTLPKRIRSCKNVECESTDTGTNKLACCLSRDTCKVMTPSKCISQDGAPKSVDQCSKTKCTDGGDKGRPCCVDGACLMLASKEACRKRRNEKPKVPGSAKSCLNVTCQNNLSGFSACCVGGKCIMAPSPSKCMNVVSGTPYKNQTCSAVTCPIPNQSAACCTTKLGNGTTCVDVPPSHCKKISNQPAKPNKSCSDNPC